MLTVAIVEGLGVGVKSRLAVQEELETGLLEEVLPGSLYAPDAPISFVFAAENRNSPKIRAFQEIASRAFRR